MNAREQGRLVELRRRIDNLLRVGQVTEVDPDRARVRVHYGVGAAGSGLETQTDWIPWLTQRAGADRTWWAPSAGEQVLVLAPAGDLAQAVALPAIFRRDAAPPAQEPSQHVTVYADGAVLRYDVETHVASIELAPGGRIRLGIEGDKRLVVEDFLDLYNGHVHPDPQGGTTGAPSAAASRAAHATKATSAQ